MFEVLLTLCLGADPAACRTERHPAGPDLAECRAEAREAARRAPPGETAQSWPCVPQGTHPVFTVSEVAPGVFVHKGRHAEAGADNLGDLANTGFVIGDEAVAVIDAGGSHAVGAALLAEIRRHTDLPVRWLILTHMHPDHSLGASVFADAGAQVVGHPKLARALEARAAHYLEANATLIGPGFAATVAPPVPGPAPERIDLGGRTLRLMPHPTAHTDNDLTVLDVATGTWFVGDLVFIDHMPALDGSIVGWRRELDEMRARPVARIVPGHGPVAADWPASAAPISVYLSELETEIRKALADGRPMLETIRATGSGLQDKWLLWSLFAQRNASAAYSELEWE